MHILSRLFGTHNDRILKRYHNQVKRINLLEPALQALPDYDLQQMTISFKQRLSQGQTLDSLLVEAFAVCREASRRVLNLRHFDVQLLGGIALHEGKIAEMATGEGKTLMAALPIYLNALTGQGVHVVTVNDYLAQRDAGQMSKLFAWLGLSTGVNATGLSAEQKRQAYAADITYGTNNEYGFDFLRDNMVYTSADRVQRALHFAIVDEVDSILIDEARTPLIISGHTEDDTALYQALNHIPALLVQQIGEETPDRRGVVEKPGDYVVDEKMRQVFLTEAGHVRVEAMLHRQGLLPAAASLYDPSHLVLLHHLQAALRAHTLFHKDKDYVIVGDEVVIVDEFTGRMMPGRRWSDGLHQAIEAKERVTIQQENQTLASITFQNYFRMYDKLAGMTGTAATEAYEFHQIYNLETVVIPPNRPSQRCDHQDRVYLTLREKQAAIIADVKECFSRGQPVLIGTASVDNSERLSQLLQREKLPHQVLNAKNHAREAEIIAQAGLPKQITIATNMAGRGTDIVLGGNIDKELQQIENDLTLSSDTRTAQVAQLRHTWQERNAVVIAAGGLHIIGTERHESRRIDNQLRGRAGRQGDPGSSRFYLSFEDPLLRIFAEDRLRPVLDKFSLPAGQPIEAAMVTRAVESAQRRVESHNFDIRKELLEYDDVTNDQRRVVYEQRNALLALTESGISQHLQHEVFMRIVRTYVPEDSVEEEWDVNSLMRALRHDWHLVVDLHTCLSEPDLSDKTVLTAVLAAADQCYAEKIASLGKDAFLRFERIVLLQSLDAHWRDHLSALQQLREGIHLRVYAQKNPKQEYKREAFALFSLMLDLIAEDAVKTIFTSQLHSEADVDSVEQELPRTSMHDVQYRHVPFVSDIADEDPFESKAPDAPVTQRPVVRTEAKLGRNAPCSCGSGLKYKQCHGKTA